MLSAVAARKASVRQVDEQSAQSSPHLTSIQASREWSPSRPVELKEPEAPIPAESTVISNFSPILGQNIFPLTEDDLSAMGFQGDDGLVLVLNASESVALLGVYLLVILQGRANLCGVTLGPSSTQHRVFAPRSSPIPVVSWAPTDTHSKRPLPSIVHANPDATVVLIQYVNTGVEDLSRVFRVFENVFKPPRMLPQETSEFPKYVLYVIANSTKDIVPFTFPPSWETGLVYMDPVPNSETDTTVIPVCVVKGPKKSGKSTFSRTLLNRLLNRYRRVAFLECDVGQSEFTPGGMVALSIIENHVFGPPFTHPSLPYRAHYVGSSTPRANPFYYLSAIQSLLETYRLEIHIPALPDTSISNDGRIEDVVPLVVNTMGWTKGLGAELNARVEELVEPSHVFEVEGSEEWGWPTRSTELAEDTFPLCGHAKSIIHIQLEAIQAEATNMHVFSAADHRNINMLSYFHATFPLLTAERQPSTSIPLVAPSPASLRQVTADSWDVTLPLCARYPFEVRCESAFDRVYLVGHGYEDIAPLELPSVLNCAVVGLVAYDANTKEAEVAPMDQDVSALPYSPGQPQPHPSTSNCLDLALIRGFFSSSDPSPTPSHSPLTHLHILTPLPPSTLGHARILVKGELELPIWGMLDFREGEEGGVAGVEREQVPYLQWGKGEGLGSERRRVRRNLMRKAQM
ncbi:hypothetical protein EDC04DRAFT_3112463 [Pisolithus marmoratus]|nr:hypothetical protein EDC04DRAFT_3112463 [Pisolithus marmoratus]